jgi:serine/threonine-protein kinase
MAAALTRAPDPLDSVRDDVPPSFAAVIMRCLEKLPENRPQTATALLDELDGVATPASGATIATVKLPATAQAPKTAQRRALLAGASLVIIAGVAVAVTTWSRRGNGEAIQSVTAGTTPASAAAPGSQVTVPTATAGAASNRTLGDSATRTPIVLSRAESLAIAEAVRKRITARRDSQIAKGERAFADSLSRRFERALSDSLARIMAELRGGRRAEVRGFDPMELRQLQEMAKRAAAVPNVPGVTMPGAPNGPAGSLGGAGATTGYRIAPRPGGGVPIPPPPPGVHRVLVGVARSSIARHEPAGLSAVISDSIRRAIAARPGYDVIDAAALTDPRLYGTRTRTSLARSVGAGAVLTGLFFPRPDSMLVLQLQLFDVQKNRVVRVLESRPIDPKDPMRGVGELIAGTLTAFNDIDWRPVTIDSLGPKKP